MCTLGIVRSKTYSLVQKTNENKPCLISWLSNYWNVANWSYKLLTVETLIHEPCMFIALLQISVFWVKNFIMHQRRTFGSKSKSNKMHYTGMTLFYSFHHKWISFVIHGSKIGSSQLSIDTNKNSCASTIQIWTSIRTFSCCKPIYNLMFN